MFFSLRLSGKPLLDFADKIAKNGLALQDGDVFD